MRRDIRWASVGAHYNNGTKDGEKIKIVAMLTHPKFADLSNDFMVLELESPSSHEPVALAAADGSDITVGEWGDVIGWKFIAGNGTTPSRRANELQSAKVRLMSSEECSTMMHIDDTMVCSGGLANEDPCQGAIGSPLIVERSRGGQSGQDVVVGVVSWGKDCNLANTPSVLARVSSGRTWIDGVTGSACFA
ncbi:Glucanase inhibitor protein 3 [Phytophthora ramorum]|uniref:Glucanase inhibitor protein 3 n=1 Tax=Phytophthora ramorum TaxID=164328 RepID=UPI0030A93B63|nr:Glucanase inhibitor protein 3 [Phytophthora ramorum]